jgi:hypothetical protein
LFSSAPCLKLLIPRAAIFWLYRLICMFEVVGRPTLATTAAAATKLVCFGGLRFAPSGGRFPSPTAAGFAEAAELEILPAGSAAARKEKKKCSAGVVRCFFSQTSAREEWCLPLWINEH